MVLTKVSAAELKIRQKLSEQREKEESKLQDTRRKEAQKIINKVAGTKMGLEALINKTDFGTLPEMVRSQLEQLYQKLERIHDTCTNITAGSDEGAMMTMLDTIHT